MPDVIYLTSLFLCPWAGCGLSMHGVDLPILPDDWHHHHETLARAALDARRRMQAGL